MIGLALAMLVTADGMVMNANEDVLPRGCNAISRDYEFHIDGGRSQASQPGTIFGFSRHALEVEPCSRVTVTFTNRDTIRHQWMVHGLPRYLYPGGMFHLEANGGKSMTGTFILPPEDATYLVHCDMAQHMEKGMKGQLKVGAGSGDLWGVAGTSGAFFRDSYLPARWSLIVMPALILGGALAWWSTRKRLGHK